MLACAIRSSRINAHNHNIYNLHHFIVFHEISLKQCAHIYGTWEKWQYTQAYIKAFNFKWSIATLRYTKQNPNPNPSYFNPKPKSYPNPNPLLPLALILTLAPEKHPMQSIGKAVLQFSNSAGWQAGDKQYGWWHHRCEHISALYHLATLFSSLSIVRQQQRALVMWWRHTHSHLH